MRIGQKINVLFRIIDAAVRWMITPDIQRDQTSEEPICFAAMETGL